MHNGQLTARKCEAGDVLFLTGEDDAADTLRPRLEAAGADLMRVHLIEGVRAAHTENGTRQNRIFSLQRDLPRLAEKLTELDNVAAVFIDPISAYLGDIDSYKNAEVRGVLAPLSELAARYNVAIIVISHLNKTVSAQAIMRISGSIAFVGAARAAWLVAADPDDKERRLFLPMKNNLGPDASGLAYRIDSETVPSAKGPIDTSRVTWEWEPVTRTADEVMQANAQRRVSARGEAEEWLENLLAGGPVAAVDIFERARAEGLSGSTRRRAKGKLGIKTMKADFKGGWLWCLPAKMAEDGQEE